MPKHNLKTIALKALEATSRREGEHYVTRLKRDEGYKIIPRDLIDPNPDQPRKHIDQKAIEDLAASIKMVGVLQPLIVRPNPERPDRFLLIAGERRWQASGIAHVKELPCIVRHQADHDEISLIENLQREDLTPLEEAEALLRLQSTKSYTHQQLAQVIGKSRASVTESLSLNGLPEAVKAACRTSDKWTKSQLSQLLRAGSPEKLGTLWEGLQRGEPATVRELRKKTRKKTAASKGGRPQHVRLEYAPAGRSYRLTLTFTKRSATRADVRGALKAALKDLPKQVHA
jgi:ParB family chromosome partitioning protein